ncbi:MAG: peroxiredoxin [Pseudomonadota bacterium]
MLNQPAPDFELSAHDGSQFKLSEQRGKKLLLVFYPGDNTPVCTAQLCDYRDGFEEFQGLGVDIVGISHDGERSHQRFRDKHNLPFALLTDKDYSVAKAYDSKGLLGMKRSVFLVDEEGVIQYAHVENLALFRRTRDELIKTIQQLDNQ